MTEEQRIKRNQRQESWKKENRERINLLFPKGTKKKILEDIQDTKISISEYVLMAINEKIEKNT